MKRTHPRAGTGWSSRVTVAAFLCALTPARSVAQVSVGPDRPGLQSTLIAVDYTYSHFSDATAAWQLGSASIAHRRPRGIFIARANVAQRFAVEGLQVELDAYPRLGDNSYAFFSAGYSAASIYPRWRFGGEALRLFSRGWETSIGFRRLEFREVDVTLFTGSLGRYVGNNWFSFRPYVRAGGSGTASTGDTEVSASFTARHYSADPESYVGARFGGGTAPDDRLTPGELTRVNAWNVGLYGSKTAGARAYLNWGADSFWEEISAGRVRNRLELLAGFKLRY